MIRQRRTKAKFKYPITPQLNLKSLLKPPIPKPTDNNLLAWGLWFIRTELIELNRERGTVDSVRDDLQKFISFFFFFYPDGNITNWTTSVTHEFFKLLGAYQRSSQRRIYTSLVHFAGFLVRKGIINDEDDPIKKYKCPPHEQSAPQSLRAIADDGDTILEGYEVFEMLASTAEDAAHQHRTRALPLRDLALIYVLHFTALRASEVASLTVEQLVLHKKSKGAFFVGVRCKGGISRDFYLPLEGLKPLLQYMRKERERILTSSKTDNPHLFLSYRGRQLSRIDMQRILNRIKAATIDREREKGAASFEIKAHPHSFRHERVYSLLREGLSESEVAREVGHAGTSYIGVYSNRSKDDRAERLKNIK